MRVAAIDVGTNTTRLLIAETNDRTERYRSLERRLVFTRLGEGVDSRRRLEKTSIERTCKAITSFCAICGEFDVQELRIAATSAVRDASNPDDFLGPVAKIAGIAPTILSGEQEASLSFTGAVFDLPVGRYLVSDIGGGSTEYISGNSSVPELAQGVSLDIGSVRLTERFLRSDPPSSEEMETLIESIDEALPGIDPVAADAAAFVGVAGTVTSLAAVLLGLEDYDPLQTHHFRMTRASVEDLLNQLAGMTLADRLQLPSLPKGRADVIVAGAAILAGSMRHWGFRELIVSERDILDGLVLELIHDLSRESS